MQDPELYRIGAVCETYPVNRDLEQSFTGKEAEQIRSEADVAFRLDRKRNSKKPGYKYWIDMKILATGELVKIENVSQVEGTNFLEERVAKEAEKHLGKTGLTIMNGSGFGFEE